MMKTTCQILLLAVLLAGCIKEEPDPQPISVTWKLNTQSDFLKEREFDRQIEYYNENHMITHKEYHSVDTFSTATYVYNNDRQLVEYAWKLHGIYRYYYENGLMHKKEYLDYELKSNQYTNIYEYPNADLHKKYFYDRYGTLRSTVLSYYSSGNLDSIYHFFEANLDSIEGKTIYTYDDNHHLLEENGWKWSYEKMEFYHVYKTSYEYKNNLLTRMETWMERNAFSYNYQYYYDARGRKCKIEMYAKDQFLGSYDATYSSNVNEYIIPEL